MKKLIFILLLLTVSIAAEITINKPLMTLVDKEGNIVATESTSIEKAMEKASGLSNGVYILQRPDVLITVNNQLFNNLPVAVTGGDQTANVGDIVYLPCNLSYDTDGEIVKCEWLQTNGIAVEILYTPEGNAYFIAPNPLESELI